MKKINAGKTHTPKKTKEQIERDTKIQEGWTKMETKEWNYKDFLENLSTFEGEDEDGYVPRYIGKIIFNKSL